MINTCNYGGCKGIIQVWSIQPFISLPTDLIGSHTTAGYRIELLIHANPGNEGHPIQSVH